MWKKLILLFWGTWFALQMMAAETTLPIADPYVLLYEGTYYAYGTSRDDGVEVYTSDDLQTWQRAPRLALRKEDSYGDRWFWAPEVYYVAAKKQFYMFYSANEHICVATSDSPLGPFVQSEKRPIWEEKSIDTSVFWDDNGKAYLYFVRFTDGNVIWCAELTADLMHIREETLTRCITASETWEMRFGKVAEGPSVLKHDGLYYLIYSANDYRSPDYAVGFATASSPLGVWKKNVHNPLMHKVENLVGTGHGAPFTDKTGRLRYVFHAHKNATEVHPRNTYIVDMSIGGDEGVTIGGNLIRPCVKE